MASNLDIWVDFQFLSWSHQLLRWVYSGVPPRTPESLPRFAPLSRLGYSRKGKGRHQEELPDSPGREGLKGEVLKPKETALRLDNGEADG